MKILIKSLTENRIIFQGEITTKTEYKVIESMYPPEKYSRENVE